MVKLVDIAQAANVSKAAVSYAFSSDPAKRGKLSEATLARILRTAEELDYSPSWTARAFARQKSYNIALLMPEYCASNMSMHYLRIFHGVSSAIGDSDYNLSVFFGCDKKFMTNMQQGRLDGVLVIARRDESEFFQTMAQWELPMVFLNRTAPACCKKAGSCSSDYDKWLTEVLQKYLLCKIKKCTLYYREARESDQIICRIFSKLCQEYNMEYSLVKREDFVAAESGSGLIFCGASPKIIASIADRSDIAYTMLVSPEINKSSGLDEKNLYYHDSKNIGVYGVQMLLDMLEKHSAAQRRLLPLLQVDKVEFPSIKDGIEF